MYMSSNVRHHFASRNYHRSGKYTFLLNLYSPINVCDSLFLPPSPKKTRTTFHAYLAGSNPQFGCIYKLIDAVKQRTPVHSVFCFLALYFCGFLTLSTTPHPFWEFDPSKPFHWRWIKKELNMCLWTFRDVTLLLLPLKSLTMLDVVAAFGLLGMLARHTASKTR